MLGAIIGDVVGSTYELENTFEKDFILFRRHTRFTDDTVCTVATAETLLEYGKADDETFGTEYARILRKYVKKYPHRGYSGEFERWAADPNMGPYHSFGNGSAMRVSPVLWYAETLDEAERLARLTASVTHNHPEGIKGAVVAAGTGFLARTVKDKKKIREYVEQYYTLDITCGEWRKRQMPFDSTCPGTVPIALECFFESKDFEDAIRTAVSMGGDSDTIAAITGGVAEAFYGPDEFLSSAVRLYIDKDLLAVIDEFTNKYLR